MPPLPSNMTLIRSEPIGTYFIKETDEQVSAIHRVRVEGKNKKSGKKWSKFFPKETFTLKISTVQGKKTINCYQFLPKSRGSSKLVMSNITNSHTELGRSFFLVAIVEKPFMEAANRLLEKHGFPAVSSIYNFRELAYPLIKDYFNTALNPKIKVVSPFLAPIGRIQSTDEFCEKYRITDPELIQWVQQQNPLSLQSLFWLSTLANVHTNETVHQILKLLPQPETPEFLENEKTISLLQNTPNQYRGMFSKVPADVLISLVQSNNFSYEELSWSADAWSKNYRTLRKNREPLTSLSQDKVSEYILRFIYPKIYFSHQAKLDVKNTVNQKIESSFLSRPRQKIISEDGIMSYRSCSVYQLVGMGYVDTNNITKLSHRKSKHLPYFIKTGNLNIMFPGLMNQIEPLLFGSSSHTQFLVSPLHVRYFFYICERYFKKRFSIQDEARLNLLFMVLETNISYHMTSNLPSYMSGGLKVLQQLFPEAPHSVKLRNNQLNILLKLVDADFPLTLALEMAVKEHNHRELLDVVLASPENFPLEIIHTYFGLEIPLDSPAPF